MYVKIDNKLCNWKDGGGVVHKSFSRKLPPELFTYFEWIWLVENNARFKLMIIFTHFDIFDITEIIK